MGDKSKYKIIKMILVLFIILIPKEVEAEFKDQKEVLYINSYSPRSTFFNDELNGIRSVLDDEVDIHVEYLDQGNFYGVESELNFYNLLKYKMNSYNEYDAILIGDDPALNFVKKYRKELFKDIPIVAFGINMESNIDYIQKMIIHMGS